MTEKRKLERKNFIRDIEILDRNGPVAEEGGLSVLGDLADITVEGVMLVSDEPVSEKTIFQMRIILPEEIEGVKEIDFEAESIRCNKTIHDNIYTTGFRITKLDQNNHSIVENLISKFAV
ncbi:MAG: hypothetical protein HN580_17645 [Deltaproteobacteria bacterium]|jgi:hypothetical protein|nr:hypothetical protein [Deltaproteobacteria bacterium]MBT4643094.1 hypothetical protein [Deltaproteobacteria bacterium]MBT6498880.1 hypothetical protein [Deltaproteobacteria bacterium]MBT6616185.1 hypothetical protein [Deltaproteobacteria bacterium]MBT7153638.1 hypothetical protein [Deltaproteobacteria bacterium]